MSELCSELELYDAAASYKHATPACGSVYDLEYFWHAMTRRVDWRDALVNLLSWMSVRTIPWRSLFRLVEKYSLFYAFFEFFFEMYEAPLGPYLGTESVILFRKRMYGASLITRICIKSTTLIIFYHSQNQATDYNNREMICFQSTSLSF